MEKMITKKIKQIKGLFTPKNLPRLIISLIILGVLYFVYEKFLKEGFKEGFETSSGDLDDQVKSGTKLVLFYADWCGHCKKVKPDWTATASKLNTKDDVKMIMVNCGEGTEDDKAVMEKYSVDGYPTILKFVDGTPTLYQGERTSEGFKKIFS
jgi:thiol-disulfide isomerase/thioredoxin